MSRSDRTLFIGDVHGCLNELERLLVLADFSKKTRLVLAGDLINKGPDSAGVLALAREYKARVILGNHEIKLMEYLKAGREDQADMEAVKQNMGSGLKHWVSWMKTWPLFLESPDWLVVHAGLEPGKHPSRSHGKLLTRIRTWDGVGKQLNQASDPPWYRFYTEKKPVIFGHWAMRGLVVRDNAIGLDTGCVYGGSLTAVSLPDYRFFQVPAARRYCKPEG